MLQVSWAGMQIACHLLQVKGQKVAVASFCKARDMSLIPKAKAVYAQQMKSGLPTADPTQGEVVMHQQSDKCKLKGH